MKNKKKNVSYAFLLGLLTAMALPAYANTSCTLPVYAAASAVPAPLHVDGTAIKDAQGRTVVLRGANMSGDSKVPPFMPITSATMLDPLAGLGINTLRLLFTWEAFEGTRCDYDEAYLQYYEQIVAWAAQRNIYVIVDFHQDAFSRFSIEGCGEGFPAWAVTSEVGLKTPKNDASCSGWGTKMITDLSHHKTWEKFHADTEGAKTRYIDMVTYVADRMAKHSNVIGYELINEPWGTDAELASLYNAVGSAIRSRHANSILFVPPHALVSSGGPANNIPKPSFGNFVYSPHYYDALVILSKIWLFTSPNGALDKMAKKAAEWGVPLLLGEYGAPATTINVNGYMNALNNWLNKGFHSGTQWNYTPTWRADIKDGWNDEDLSIVNDNGQLRANFKARPYPVAIAGTPVSFTQTDSKMVLKWKNTAAQGVTRIFVPVTFAAGKPISISGGASCSRSGTMISCTAANNANVTVTLQ